ncbi:MAG: RecX family transcriptional regulator [Armatimonadota bacterium]|nr:RecX family transcriptional regulator [Armatimonadota bacterium]
MTTHQHRITAIEAQEKRQNRRSIFVDGKFVLGVDANVVADLGLQIGQEISEERLREIVYAEQLTKAKQKALNLLGYRARSRAEIAQSLRRGGFAEDIIEDVLAYLERLGLVNDEQFSQAWVKSRLIGKGMGKQRIKWELKQKGVPNDVAEDALSEIDEEIEYQTALDSAKRRWAKYKDAEVNTKRRKLASFLRRQGFGWEVVSQVLGELSADNDEE